MWLDHGHPEILRESNAKDIIVATEEGVRYMLEKESPDKTFHFASGFMVCPNMKVHNVKKMVRALETMQPQIHVDPEVAKKRSVLWTQCWLLYRNN